MLVLQSEQEAAMIRDGNEALWRRLKGALIGFRGRPTDDAPRNVASLETGDALAPGVGQGDAREAAYAPDEAEKQRAGFSQHINC
jgi:hypothetical protein